MRIPIDKHPGDLEPDDITEIISVLMEHVEEHGLHAECTARCLSLTLIIDKLVWLLPSEPIHNWLDTWRESWERDARI